ncbi:MAG: hypothetical protein WCK01_02675 [Candidatus Uhrbacteria bacterium]
MYNRLKVIAKNVFSFNAHLSLRVMLVVAVGFVGQVMMSAPASATLGSASVQPLVSTVSNTGEVDVAFTPVNNIRGDYKIRITFAAGFDVSGANSGTCPTLATTYITSVSGQIVTLSGQVNNVAGGITPHYCTIQGIKNPSYAQTTASSPLAILNVSNGVWDSGTAPGVVITAGALTGVDVQPASLAAGTSGTVAVTFTNPHGIPPAGVVAVAFPAGFIVGGAFGGTCTGMNGTFSTLNGGQVVYIVRNGTTTSTSALQSCSVSGITNPSYADAFGTYTVSTQIASGGANIDTATAASDTITAGTLVSTNVEPPSLFAGAVGTSTISFTTANPIPATGKILVTFPSGYILTGVNVGSCSTTMDGTFSVAVTGQVITITRAGGTIEPVGPQTCAIGRTVNPGVSGSTGVYDITTKNASNQFIDQDAAVAADTISSGTISGTSVTPASLAIKRCSFSRFLDCLA